MKEIFNKILKNKMVVTLLVCYSVTIIMLLISSFVQGLMVATMFAFAISCLVTCVKYVFDYRNASKNKEKEYLPLSDEEIKKIDKKISSTKRDIILKILMFAVFGIAFIVFGIRMCV